MSDIPPASQNSKHDCRGGPSGQRLPIPQGQQAFWIIPNGRILDIGKATHIAFMVQNHGLFRLPSSLITSCYHAYDEPIGSEGKAREWLIKIALQSGFIALRFLADKSGSWISRLWDLDNPATRQNLGHWAQLTLGQGGLPGGRLTPVRVDIFETNTRWQTNLGELKLALSKENTMTGNAKPDAYSRHEILDRASLVMMNFDDWILQHPALTSAEKEKAQAAFDRLFEFYQYMGDAILKGLPVDQ